MKKRSSLSQYGLDVLIVFSAAMISLAITTLIIVFLIEQ